MGLIALLLLSAAAFGMVRLPTMERQALLAALRSLLLWLPVLYAVVALSYAGRYWRWRLLLGRLGIGRTNWLGVCRTKHQRHATPPRLRTGDLALLC